MYSETGRCIEACFRTALTGLNKFSELRIGTGFLFAKGGIETASTFLIIAGFGLRLGLIISGAFSRGAIFRSILFLDSEGILFL